MEELTEQDRRLITVLIKARIAEYEDCCISCSPINLKVYRELTKELVTVLKKL